MGHSSNWRIAGGTCELQHSAYLESLRNTAEMLKSARGQILKGFKYLVKKSKLNSQRNHDILVGFLLDGRHQPSIHSLPYM